MKLVLATHNKNKVAELRDILDDANFDIRFLDDFQEIGDIAETGDTLKENAFIKAREVHRITGLPALADDTGLMVDALNGAPGVYSARYAGETASYEDNCQKMLEEMVSISNRERNARFCTVAAFVDSERDFSVEGCVEGEITREYIGKGGFGYDPIFREKQSGKTFAQMSLVEKSKISHRGIAFRKMKNTLVSIVPDMADKGERL